MDLGTLTTIAANLLGALAAILTIGGIAYKRPSSVIEKIAERTGIEVYLSAEAAIEAELGEGREAVAELAKREAVSVWFDPAEAITSTLTEADSPIVEFDGDGIAIDGERIREADREEQLEHLGQLGNELELPAEAWCVDPIKKIARLEDDPRNAYVWLLGDRATGDDVSSLTHRFEEAFAEAHNREPAALHLIVRDVDAIEEISEEAIENVIKPWLRDRDRAAELEEVS